MPSAIYLPSQLNDLAVDVSLGTPAQGALLYRGASKWNALAAGTAGQVLQSGGAGANPSWATLPNTAPDFILTRAGRSAPADPRYLTITAGADTNLAAGTEANDVLLSLNRIQTWATGAIASQRAVWIRQPTYAFAGASTITSASTVNIEGAPLAGTNATLTSSQALKVHTGADVGKALVLQANSGTQSANLLEWQNSAGALLGAWGPDARLAVGGAPLASTHLFTCCTADTFKGVVVQGNSATQSANLFTAQDNTGSPLWSITGAGLLQASLAAVTSRDLTQQFLMTDPVAARQRASLAYDGSFSRLRLVSPDGTNTTDYEAGNATTRFLINSTTASLAFQTTGTGSITLSPASGGTASVSLQALSGNGVFLTGGPDCARLVARNSSSQTTDVIVTQDNSNRQLWSVTALGNLTMNRISSTSTSRQIATVVGTFAVSTDASRTGRVVHNVVDFAGTREALRLEADGTAARLGVLGAAAVVRQAGASAAGIAAVTDANARAALTALQAALAAYGLVTSPA